MKDPVELYPPSGNHVFVVPCVDDSGEQIPFTLLDNVSLDLRYGPAIESVVSKSCMHPYSGFTHVSTAQPPHPQTG